MHKSCVVHSPNFIDQGTPAMTGVAESMQEDDCCRSISISGIALEKNMRKRFFQCQHTLSRLSRENLDFVTKLSDSPCNADHVWLFTNVVCCRCHCLAHWFRRLKWMESRNFNLYRLSTVSILHWVKISPRGWKSQQFEILMLVGVFQKCNIDIYFPNSHFTNTQQRTVTHPNLERLMTILKAQQRANNVKCVQLHWGRKSLTAATESWSTSEKVCRLCADSCSFSTHTINEPVNFRKFDLLALWLMTVKENSRVARKCWALLQKTVARRWRLSCSMKFRFCFGERKRRERCVVCWCRCNRDLDENVDIGRYNFSYRKYLSLSALKMVSLTAFQSWSLCCSI